MGKDTRYPYGHLWDMYHVTSLRAASYSCVSRLSAIHLNLLPSIIFFAGKGYRHYAFYFKYDLRMASDLVKTYSEDPVAPFFNSIGSDLESKYRQRKKDRSWSPKWTKFEPFGGTA
ncbi:hypothetical protein BC343_19525 [Mucilaginibacter pedocola]|uniref:Uncharacterized protein n=1 Tax=Mucilaginibacter pedocola TaxID=1792845 RepID=A0A1S9P6P4_9SPHI|nr:hypothetical protein BC343_19525 [Mucilaginibacter pedocola]